MNIEKIIFLEDDQNLAKLYVGKLRNAGYQVELCESTDELLKTIADFKPDLAFLDHALHGEGKSGFDVIEPLKKGNPDIKVIMLSNYSDFQMREATLQQGAIDYLVKLNTSPSDLVNYIRTNLT